MTQTTELPATETDSAAVRSDCINYSRSYSAILRRVYEAIRSGKFPDRVCDFISPPSPASRPWKTSAGRWRER